MSTHKATRCSWCLRASTNRRFSRRGAGPGSGASFFPSPQNVSDSVVPIQRWDRRLKGAARTCKGRLFPPRKSVTSTNVMQHKERASVGSHPLPQSPRVVSPSRALRISVYNSAQSRRVLTIRARSCVEDRDNLHLEASAPSRAEAFWRRAFSSLRNAC